MDIKKAIELMDNESYDESLQLLHQLVNQEKHRVSALYWRASVYLRMEDRSNALKDINEAIELYDEYADAYGQRGVIYFHMGQLDKALKDMQKAVALEPQNPYRYSSRAYILGHLKQMDLAIADYKKAIELDPEDAVAYNNLGLLEEQIGYQNKAKQRFEKADQLAVNNQGELVEQNSAEKLVLDHKAAVKIQPTSKESSGYLNVFKSVFTSKSGFKEYWKFLKDLFNNQSHSSE